MGVTRVQWRALISRDGKGRNRKQEAGSTATEERQDTIAESSWEAYQVWLRHLQKINKSDTEGGPSRRRGWRIGIRVAQWHLHASVTVTASHACLDLTSCSQHFDKDTMFLTCSCSDSDGIN